MNGAEIARKRTRKPTNAAGGRASGTERIVATSGFEVGRSEARLVCIAVAGWQANAAATRAASSTIDSEERDPQLARMHHPLDGIAWSAAFPAPITC
jgi:hypothetical protein